MALVGCGSGLPAVSLSNAQLGERVETNDDWIRSRTGIGARHVAGPGETVTSLASEAGRQALAHAGWHALEEQVDRSLTRLMAPLVGLAFSHVQALTRPPCR